MKKILRNSIILLFAGAIAGTLLLTVSFMLPVRAEMYQQSMATLESDCFGGLHGFCLPYI